MIRESVKTGLIWAGIVISFMLQLGWIGYGPPYEVVRGMYIYEYRDFAAYGWVLLIGSWLMIMAGCYIWTRLKGRGWGYMFFGLLGIIGFIVLSQLKDKTFPVRERMAGYETQS